MTTKERTEMLWGIVEGYARAKLERDEYFLGYYIGQCVAAIKILNISYTGPWTDLLIEMVTDGNINSKRVCEANNK